METSETLGALAGALAKATLAFGTVSKDRAGQVGKARYRYATLESVLDAVAEPLAQNGLVVTQTMTTTRPAQGSGELAVVTTMLLHESGEWLRSTSQARIAPGAAKLAPVQELGKVTTYLRRYALTAILGVTAEEDDDAQGAGRDSTAPRQQQAKPAKPRKPHHDPSWEGDRAAFCSALKEHHGMSYHALADFQSANTRPRPSSMTNDGRKKLWAWLADGGADEVAAFASATAGGEE